jgi:lipoprotein Spr
MRLKIFIFSIVFLFATTAFAQQISDTVEQLEVTTDEQVSQNDFYDVIKEWLGTPYRYAGNSKKGIDCSGFVSMFYKLVFEINLDRSSADMFRTNVVKTKQKNDLQVGDLVFFAIKKKRISHVGIYLGDNKFVQSSRSNGVIISDLDEPYYSKYFFKGGSVAGL